MLRHPIRNRLALSVFGLIASVGAARADITTALVSSTNNGNNTYTYLYQVSLSANSELDATTNGVPLQFGTVYDFGTVIGGAAGITVSAGSILATSFTFALANTNAPATQTSPVDRSNVQNIRFTFNSSTGYAVAPSGFDSSYTIIPTGDANLGTFSVNSPYASTAASTAAYDGQSYKSTNNTQQSNIGLTQVPQQPTAVPEPASLALLGAGLLAARAARRRV